MKWKDRFGGLLPSREELEREIDQVSRSPGQEISLYTLSIQLLFSLRDSKLIRGQLSCGSPKGDPPWTEHVADVGHSLRESVASSTAVKHPGPMLRLLVHLFHLVRALLRSRLKFAMENLALRQQVAMLKTKRPRPRLSIVDRAFWVALRSVWSKWADALIIVRPETVVRWHRAGFKAFWRWKSRRIGRPDTEREIRKLIRLIASDNLTWGAPRVHAELQKLGFEVSERTVSRYMPKRPTEPEVIERWKVFLRNHRECIAAMDFFTVPTVTFHVLYILFVIHHALRQVLHFNVTAHPGWGWVVQQLRDAFPYDTAPRYLIFDRDGKFGPSVVAAIKAMGINPSRTAFRSPCRMVSPSDGSVRCAASCSTTSSFSTSATCLRLLRDYVTYCGVDRTHLGLRKDSPLGRPANPKPSQNAKVLSLPRVGGLHHRYEWQDAA